MGKRRAYACQLCGHHLYPCADTPFAKSRTPLSKWMFAVWLFTTSRHGIAARELERQIGVSHKCAWRMAHQIREHMARSDHSGPLGGHIEVDETTVGGVRHGQPEKRGWGTDKAKILGMVERGGRLKTRVVPNVRRATLQNLIVTNVRRGSRISSDELRSYDKLKEQGFDHQTVRHGRKEFVRGDVHTNTLEGFWSRLKLSIRGTHVHVSKKHLWKYASEFSFRYNMRKEPHLMYPKLISSL
jgi:transposase-like protein